MPLAGASPLAQAAAELRRVAEAKVTLESILQGVRMGTLSVRISMEAPSGETSEVQVVDQSALQMAIDGQAKRAEVILEAGVADQDTPSPAEVANAFETALIPSPVPLSAEMDEALQRIATRVIERIPSDTERTIAGRLLVEMRRAESHVAGASEGSIEDRRLRLLLRLVAPRAGVRTPLSRPTRRSLLRLRDTLRPARTRSMQRLNDLLGGGVTVRLALPFFEAGELNLDQGLFGVIKQVHDAFFQRPVPFDHGGRASHQQCASALLDLHEQINPCHWSSDGLTEDVAQWVELTTALSTIQGRDELRPIDRALFEELNDWIGAFLWEPDKVQ